MLNLNEIDFDIEAAAPITIGSMTISKQRLQSPQERLTYKHSRPMALLLRRICVALRLDPEWLDEDKLICHLKLQKAALEDEMFARKAAHRRIEELEAQLKQGHQVLSDYGVPEVPLLYPRLKLLLRRVEELEAHARGQ